MFGRCATGKGRTAALLCSLALFGCGSHHQASGGSAPPNPGTGAPREMPLKYYNHFPFNNVYTIGVQVGGQTLESVLDTGSSNLLVLGDAAHCPACTNEYGYQSTYSPAAGSQALTTSWSMNFAPIGAAQVQGYQDTVSWDDLTLPGFKFGLVTAEKGIPNIWGIAYQSLASPYGAPQTPLFDALAQAGSLKNQFSLRLCGLKAGSNITLGGFDAALVDKMAQVQWTPITAKIWYSVTVERMYGGATPNAAAAWSWAPAASDRVIVDSGTNPLVLPAAQMAPLVAWLRSVATQNGLTLPADFWPTAAGPGGYAALSAADVAKFPPLLVDLAGTSDAQKTITLSIAPSVYFQTREDGQRYLGIEPGQGSVYILGTVFLENYVVLHDRGVAGLMPDPSARLGFYPIDGLCDVPAA